MKGKGLRLVVHYNVSTYAGMGGSQHLEAFEASGIAQLSINPHEVVAMMFLLDAMLLAAASGCLS